MLSRQLGLVPADARRLMPGVRPSARLAALRRAPDAEALAQHPELSDGEFVILLLHTAAGIEHSLLVQYLYAAYSLNMNPALPAAGGPPADTVGWRASIARLAKERMGHLLCIQNVLRAMGGPLQFTRPRFPYRSRFYPFAFQLEPLTKNVLAKYVAAEMPERPDPAILPLVEREEIRARATAGGSGEPATRVALLYKTIIDRVQRLDAALFDPATAAWQAGPAEWGPATNNRDDAAGIKVLAVTSREQAVRALRIIARQGEGLHTAGEGSHFLRLLKIYREMPAAADLVLPVSSNPNTTVRPVAGSDDEPELLDEPLVRPGRITHPETLLWAHLFNVRYRMLLSSLHHALLLPAGDMNRATLMRWVFEEMNGRATLVGNSGLAGLAEKLASLDQHRFAGPKAGAPFELPYDLTLSDREVDRWRLHLSLVSTSQHLIARLPADSLLSSLAASDGDAESGRMQFILGQISRPARHARIPSAGGSHPPAGPLVLPPIDSAPAGDVPGGGRTSAMPA